MKYFPLIYAGLMRKKLRSLLTLLSIMVAFLLFGLLQGVNSAFSNSVQGAHLDRLVVQGKISLTEQLPFAYHNRIAGVPGVTGVTFATWFGGYYQDPKNNVFTYPVEVSTYFKVFPDIELPAEQLAALSRIRTGAIIGHALAEKYGWKVGDTVPIKSALWTKKDGTYDWRLSIVGIFRMPDDTAQEQRILLNNDYFDEGRAFGKGTVGWYNVRIDSPTHATMIAQSIDRLFANSDHETKTVSEKEFMQSFLRQIADVNFIASAIIGAVFFTLLFLTGNTMMQSVRERIPEFATMKAIGYSGGAILFMVAAEGLILALIAAIFGLAISAAIFPALKSVLGVAKLPPSVIGLGLLYATLLAVITGFLPGLRVVRLSVVQGLARR
ncbi:MAG TPA: FtsX-like permease family protein [Rhizomicrobium sp.]|nr:FtsX-like permease family protein [Rhizomicrobium sp.]